MRPHPPTRPFSPMRFIVHADDCGLTRHISEDIFACLASGPLNSVSVLMGGSYTRESLERLGDMPETRVCLHLNILEGRCCAPISQARPLVDEAGVFRHGLGHLLGLLACSAARSKRALLTAIRNEFEAQIDAFTTAFPHLSRQGGLHLDGHLHVHVIPALREILRGILREHAPAYVRLPQEPWHLPPLPLPPLAIGCARRALLSRWARNAAPLLDQTGTAHNDVLCGLVSGGNLTPARVEASLKAICRHGPDEPLVEIMCHPGGMRPEDSEPHVRHAAFYQNAARLAEKAMLLDGGLSSVLAKYGDVVSFAPRT